MTGLEKAGHRLGNGMGKAVTALAAWPGRAETGEAKAGRWIVLLIGGWLTEQLVARTHALVLLPAAAFLCAAWAMGKPPAPRAPVDDEAADSIVLADFVLSVIGERQGVHLAELLPAIQAHSDQWAGADKTYLRRVLAASGIPVRKKLRVGVRTGIPGVHRDDVGQALVRLATPPGVAAPSDTPSEAVDAGRSTRVDAV